MMRVIKSFLIGGIARGKIKLSKNSRRRPDNRIARKDGETVGVVSPDSASKPGSLRRVILASRPGRA